MKKIFYSFFLSILIVNVFAQNSELKNITIIPSENAYFKHKGDLKLLFTDLEYLLGTVNDKCWNYIKTEDLNKLLKIGESLLSKSKNVPIKSLNIGIKNVVDFILIDFDYPNSTAGLKFKLVYCTISEVDSSSFNYTRYKTSKYYEFAKSTDYKKNEEDRRNTMFEILKNDFKISCNDSYGFKEIPIKPIESNGFLKQPLLYVPTATGITGTVLILNGWLVNFKDAKTIYKDYETFTIESEFIANNTLDKEFNNRQAAYLEAERLRRKAKKKVIYGGVLVGMSVGVILFRKPIKKWLEKRKDKKDQGKKSKKNQNLGNIQIFNNYENGYSNLGICYSF